MTRHINVNKEKFLKKLHRNFAKRKEAEINQELNENDLKRIALSENTIIPINNIQPLSAKPIVHKEKQIKTNISDFEKEYQKWLDELK